jgi:phytoene dehydrogenase-like protein
MAAERVLAGDYRIPGLAHAAYPASDRLVKELDLDKAGYQPGPELKTTALHLDGLHLRIDGDRVSGDGLPGEDATAWPEFRAQYLEFAATLKPLFENRPPRLKNMDFADKKTLAKLGWKLRFGLGRETMYEFLRVAGINIYDVLNEAFDDDRLKGAVALDAVLGSAMGPRTPGTVLTWLERLHGELGGGLCALANGNAGLLPSLERAARNAGAEIRVNARVEEILVETGVAGGVRLVDGETISSKLVVSNVDPRVTFGSLVGAPRLDAMFANRVQQIRGAGVVAKLHLALSGTPAFSGLDEAALDDRLVVAPSMRAIEQAFNSSKYGEYSSEPVLEITVPSRHDSSLAPAVHHVMSVNVAFVPYQLDGGWDGQKEALADKLVEQISRYCPGLGDLIVARELLTPADIEKEYGVLQGHWHHGELTLHQSFMMRPLHGAAQYDTPVDGLYLCGAGCHPGGGITALPGRNAAKRILERETAR